MSAFSRTVPSSGMTIRSARSRYLRMVVGEQFGPMWSSQAWRSSSTVSDPVLTLPFATLATMAASSCSATGVDAETPHARSDFGHRALHSGHRYPVVVMMDIPGDDVGVKTTSDLVGRVGLDPTTLGLKVPCSTR